MVTLDRALANTGGDRVLNLRDLPTPLPDDVMRIDRTTRWGNPYKVGSLIAMPSGTRICDRETAVALFELYLRHKLETDPDWLKPLRGKRLACWCVPLACHGDVIARYIP